MCLSELDPKRAEFGRSGGQRNQPLGRQDKSVSGVGAYAAGNAEKFRQHIAIPGWRFFQFIRLYQRPKRHTRRQARATA